MKNIWIINHYATPPSFGGLTRHHYFAKHLKERGKHVEIFASSAIHNSNVNMFTKNDKGLYTVNTVEDVEYIHIKTSQYSNKFMRVINILQYYFRTFKVAKKMMKPDIIYTSSPQPLSALLSIKIAKKYKIPCIVEIRDLWPESIVSFGLLSKKNIIIKLLYKLEKYIYLHADKIVFTMEGGIEYLKEQNYSSKINFDRVYNINNGIDLEKYRNDLKNFKLDDIDLNNKRTFKAIYTGSIRYIYNIGKLVEMAKQLKNEENIRILVYGDGPYRKELKKYCKENNISNIIFKGFVDTKYIPYILSKADLCLLHGNNSDVFRYGMSTNKSFMYFASGKPILSAYNNKYDLIEKYGCGITLTTQDNKVYAKTILKLSKTDKESYKKYCENSLKLSKEYDYKRLTDRLIDIIEEE